MNVVDPAVRRAQRRDTAPTCTSRWPGAAEKIPNLRGIVLASDGDWNEGPPPVQAAARLRMRGVPVFAVPVGSRTRLPDVELLSLDVPTFGVAGKSVRIPFTIDSSLPREYVTRSRSRTSDGDEVSKEVRIAAMSRTSDWLVWKPKATGDFTLTLDGPQARRRDLDRQQQADRPDLDPRGEAARAGRRVVSAVGVPLPAQRPVARPGRRAVVPAVPSRALSKAGGGNKDYIKQFPAGLDELSKFDVVFLGDVGVEDGQLTAEQCRLLKGLVEHQASGLVFMPGWQGREFSLLETELGDLCPVVLDPAQPGGWGSRIAQPLRADRAGPPQPAHQAGRHPGRQRRGLGGAARLPVVRAGAPGQGRQRRALRPQGRVERIRPAAAPGHADLRRRQGPLHGDRRRLAVAQGGRGQVPLSLLGPGGALDGLPAEHGQGRDDAALLRARPAQAEPDPGAARQRDGARAASRSTAAR